MKARNFLRVLILGIIIIYVSTSFGHISQGYYGWTKRIGGTVNETGYSITTDASGNIFLMGDFMGTVDFGADFGAADTKTSAGVTDTFVTEINSDGTYGWTRRIGGISGERGRSITADPSGSVYITGDYRDTVDFGADFQFPNLFSETSAGGSDIYITKLWRADPFTIGLMVVSMGGTSDDAGLGITTDSSGNVYVTGYFAGVADFGAYLGTPDWKLSAGDKDIFITRIDADTAHRWTRSIGGTSEDAGSDITTDPSGNVYTTGIFSEAVDFGADFGVADTKTSAGATDIFITKINLDGTYGWTKRIGGTVNETGYSITTDASGNIFLTGDFMGTVDFGDDFGVADTKTSAGVTDICITKINSDGTYGWTRRIGGTATDTGYSITSDISGNVYITGIFSEAVDFGADFGAADTKTSAGATDIFITKINSDGTYGWTRRIGGTAPDTGNSITTDASGNIFLTGDFRDTVDFGADFGTADSKVSLGERDIFVTKLPAHFPIFDGHDFNGDGSSNVSIWRPSNGRWYIKGVGGTSWGKTGDIPVNGDYNGDGKTDIAVWRPSNGRWYLRGIGWGSFGILGDIPVPGDYDGDSITDISVWRPTNGKWYIRGVGGTTWGRIGDLPVPGDYNGDNKTDIAVWRPANGRWYLRGIGGAVWGVAGDIPVPGDYNGDKKTNIAVWRPSNGRWYIKGVAGAVWGVAGDIPVPGDYNGDGKTDIAIWRPSNGRWYIKGMGGYFWGTLGDVPLLR